MVIDFRVRPPYKSYLQMYNFRNSDTSGLAPGKDTIYTIDRRPVQSKLQSSIELFVQEMNESGTERAVVMGRKAENYGDVDNKDLLELCAAYPGRFIPFAGANPYQQGMIEELESLAAQGVRGISLDLGWLRKPLYFNDPLLDPLYETARDLKLIVSLTCSFQLGPDLSYSDPSTIQPVAKKYPDLQIIISHAGWPHVRKALALAMLCPNIWLLPDCYLYLANIPGSDEYVTAANTYLKYRTLYASSYPIRGFEQAIELWKDRPFTKEALRNTMHDNAARLLGEM